MKDKSYNPHEIEQKWYQLWEQNNYFAPSGKGEPYCIVIPPPNVTGTLHMGHGFQNSIMDVLIRYHRMQGYNTLWQLGTDHAGIATQLVVENLLAKEGTSRHVLGREKFIQRVLQWKDYSGDIISKQQRRLGISGDWTKTKFTLDPSLSEAVQKVFIDLYEEGLIYRGEKLVNWDPVLNTAISDLEVIDEEHDGFLWYISYPIANSQESLIVATTRPETIFGDTAVAVHPKDPRYQHLIGKHVILPLVERTIPIIADEYVDPEFGTGCVKITPAHDFNDYEIGKRHNLPIINIFTHEACINENAPKIYQNLDRFSAREKIVKDLSSKNLLAKQEKHKLILKKGDRTGVIIEPYLTHQWFVKTSKLAQAAIKVVEQGKIKFIPKQWEKTYFRWLENVEDWCISRQLWWGHRIPAWTDEENNIYVGSNEKEIRKKYNLSNHLTLIQDEDVLDTWFSAALWPFSSLGWPHPTHESQTFYPTAVLVTGFDIIFFWVARMVMMGLKFTHQIPFKEIYITGLIRDSHGQKMSKSKGNILDPVDLIDGISLEELIKKRTNHLMQQHLAEKIKKQTTTDFPTGIAGFGADALRFTFCSLATTSRDINFDVSRLEGYRNFCTKIWNATRFVMLQIENTENQNIVIKTDGKKIELSLADRWIYSELQHLLHAIENEFKNYRFDLITQKIYEFTWNQFCDWYLELVKPVMNNHTSSKALKQGACNTLLEVLEILLRAIHPFMPFITEELWQKIAKKMELKTDTIMLQKYPKHDITKIDDNATKQIEWLKKIVLAIRNIRGEINISPTKPLSLLLKGGSEQDHELINQHKQYLQEIAKIQTIAWITKEKVTQSAIALVDELELHIPLVNLINLDDETKRVKKEMDKITAEIKHLEIKLNNVSYTKKAPATVIENDRIKLAEHKNKLFKLEAKLASFLSN